MKKDNFKKEDIDLFVKLLDDSYTLMDVLNARAGGLISKAASIRFIRQYKEKESNEEKRQIPPEGIGGETN